MTRVEARHLVLGKFVISSPSPAGTGCRTHPAASHRAIRIPDLTPCQLQNRSHTHYRSSVPCIPCSRSLSGTWISLLSSVHHFSVGLNSVHLYPAIYWSLRLRHRHLSPLISLPEPTSQRHHNSRRIPHRHNHASSGTEFAGPCEDATSIIAVMSQVKNLRAMFESKGDSSPPDSRGRSPTGGSTPASPPSFWPPTQAASLSDTHNKPRHSNCPHGSIRAWAMHVVGSAVARGDGCSLAALPSPDRWRTVHRANTQFLH